MKHLQQTDKEIARLVQLELKRQQDGLELIASENYTSLAVLETIGTVLTNKYSEGYPEKRYYGGNQVIDQVELLAVDRAKKLFGAEHANVQPHSGSQANMEAFFALLELGDPILSMNLAHGGHLTHGSKVSFSGKFYDIHAYGVDKETERIDYDAVLTTAKEVTPKLIIAGGSAYSRTIDFEKFAEIAHEVGALLLVDMAHIAGLVAAKLHPSPVPHADVITSTTQKTLRGPRGGIILCKQDYAAPIDKAVMPGMQGGPFDHVIAAKAVAFQEAAQQDFITYQQAVLDNAKTLAATLAKGGIRVIAGGTDTHLVLTDVTSIGLTGKSAEQLLENIGVYTNKNMIPFDERKPLDPSGVRFGTPAITTRGFTTQDTKTLGAIIVDVLKNPEEAGVHEKAKSTVQRMVAEHPMYEELNQ